MATEYLSKFICFSELMVFYWRITHVNSMGSLKCGTK